MKIYSAPEMKLLLDYSTIFPQEDFIDQHIDAMEEALRKMDLLDTGAIANPDENRMVGHYWLRAPQLAPTAEIRKEIEDCNRAIDEFVAKVHSGEIGPQGIYTADNAPLVKAFQSSDGILRFKKVLICGIGGSALGTHFVSRSLWSAKDKMRLYFLDNTDPFGFDRILRKLHDVLDQTLTIVISKSGSTMETRNCMLEAEAYYEACGLDFSRHAVCITQRGSMLDKIAREDHWLASFPMWDWVGGRTSVMSAVGLLPLGLQGIDTKALLRGAADCDQWNRNHRIEENPAAIMALGWLAQTGGKGGCTNVVLPYKDSLDRLAHYLQQLVMESLGKEYDLHGCRVNQGLAIMGNKGSTDQHSYVQQLIGGPSNVFITLVQVLSDRKGKSILVDHFGDGTKDWEQITSGDCLTASMLGSRKALEDHGRGVMAISIPQADEEGIGTLIALFERTVGLYADLIGINAYHQPAVEYGKKAARRLLQMESDIIRVMEEETDNLQKQDAAAGRGADRNRQHNGTSAAQEADSGRQPAGMTANQETDSGRQPGGMTAAEVAAKIGASEDDTFRMLLHLAYSKEFIDMEIASPITDSRFIYRK